MIQEGTFIEIIEMNLSSHRSSRHIGQTYQNRTSPFNEVVMLLAMKKNQEAWDKISTIDVETAREYYIKAIAANRLEKIGDAIMSIEKALELDPSLLEVAKVDGDIIDLLPEEQKIK